MRTLKVNFICILSLTFFSFTNLNARDCYYSDEYELEACVEVTSFNASNFLNKTKAFYTALQAGDVPAVYAQMSTEVDWNGQTGFPYPVGDPHHNPNGLAEVLFNKVNQNWTNWEVYDLNVEESAKNTVTIKGYYKATQTDTSINVPFIHVWTWEGNQVSQFQHFETPLLIAEQ